MAPTLLPILVLLVLAVAIPLAIVAFIYLIVPVFKAIVWLVRQVFRFIAGMISDAVRLVGIAITAAVLSVLVLGSIVVGRWSATAHYGRAVYAELVAAVWCVYRLLIGHPARLLCLTHLTDGLEKRIPEIIAAAPGPDTPRARTGQFEGYTIVGSLPGGGSGGKLYVADPSPEKLAAFARTGDGDVDQVVIKSFSLRDGSSLPQIIRESRALDAAKRLGLILEHDLSDERFYYVMPYVPGDSLGLVTQRLHAESGGDGMGPRQLKEAISYATDLVETLRDYHAGGLWHKDVKPDNIIVHDGRAHLVDFGLLTSLQSSMTLTTHGTEYFRDPELVRMALKGVKVHQVDGSRFDVYAAGAVLYSMIENSFPAHGGLSQITRRCPEAVRWIVRRAMTDYDKRYASAAAMLKDLRAVGAAQDPFSLRPADLPSFSPQAEPADRDPEQPGGHLRNEWFGPDADRHAPRARERVESAGSPRPRPAGFAAQSHRERSRPVIKVTDWWTGRYSVPGAASAPGVEQQRAESAAGQRRPMQHGHGPRPSAKEQLKRARQRSEAARRRAHERISRRRGAAYPAGINPGVKIVLTVFAIAVSALIVSAVFQRSESRVLTTEAQAQRERADAASAAETIAAIGQMPGEGVRVLILREPFTFAPDRSGRIEEATDMLRRAGYQLLGQGVEGADDPQLLRRHDELVAAVRKELGLLPFRSTDARDRINAWLAETGAADLLLWWGRGDGDTAEPWLVAADSAPARARDAARIVVGKNG